MKQIAMPVLTWMTMIVNAMSGWLDNHKKAATVLSFVVVFGFIASVVTLLVSLVVFSLRFLFHF